MAHILPAIRITTAAVLAAVVSFAETALPDGEGKQLTMHVCSNCHGLNVVTNVRLTKAQWGKVVDKMASDGANATDEEFDVIIEYLAKSFGKQNSGRPSSDGVRTKLDVNRASAVQLEKFLGLSISEAAAVVRFREENGKYNNLEDLKVVRGLDPKKIETNKHRLTF